MRAPLDAIPDLSDVQVIVYTEYPGQGPRIVEDQVTYPLTTQLLGVPHAEVVRGYSFFGYSFVYVIFEDGTDLYWARARVLETLSHAAGKLPAGVTPSLGPDATGVGWAFMYALTSDRHDLGELRSIQDWFLKYELASVPGVSEVASIGGFVQQYQITVDPNRPARLRHSHLEDPRRRRGQQHRRRRPLARVRREGVHDPRARHHRVRRGHRKDLPRRRRERGAHSAEERGASEDRSRNAPGDRRVERRRRDRRRHRRRAPRRRHAQGDRRRQGQARGGQGRSARGRPRSRWPTTARR